MDMAKRRRNMVTDYPMPVGLDGVASDVDRHGVSLLGAMLPSLGTFAQMDKNSHRVSGILGRPLHPEYAGTSSARQGGLSSINHEIAFISHSPIK